MPPHVFAYRRARGVPPRLNVRGLPNFGHGNDDRQYRLIEDDDLAAEIQEYDQERGTSLLRWIEADDLVAALDTAADAVDGIEAGKYDDVLDMLLYAEQEAFGARVTVIDAITDRRRELEEQLREEDGAPDATVAPADVAPWSLG
jgi:hypothetical protein